MPLNIISDYGFNSDRDKHKAAVSQSLPSNGQGSANLTHHTKDYGVLEFTEDPTFAASTGSHLMSKRSSSSSNEAGGAQTPSMKLLLSDINDIIGSLEYEAIGSYLEFCAFQKY